MLLFWECNIVFKYSGRRVMFYLTHSTHFIYHSILIYTIIQHTLAFPTPVHLSSHSPLPTLSPLSAFLPSSSPLSYFSFQPVLHDWCNKGRGMCYPVCGMVHIKEPLLLIDKCSLCGGSGFLSHYQNGPYPYV